MKPYGEGKERKGGFSLPLALQSTLSTSQSSDLARTQLTWELGKRSLHSQPPEIQSKAEVVKNGTVGKSPVLAQRHIYPCKTLFGNCHMDKMGNRCFCDLKRAKSFPTLPLKFSMFSRIFILPIRTQDID